MHRIMVICCNSIRGKKRIPLLKDPGNSPGEDVGLSRFSSVSFVLPTSSPGLLRGSGGVAPSKFASCVVRALVLVVLIPWSAFGQDSAVSAVNQVNVDLVYSVESATIGAGTAYGNAAVWSLDSEQLAQLGLDPVGAVSNALGLGFATVISNVPIDPAVAGYLEAVLDTNTAISADVAIFNEGRVRMLSSVVYNTNSHAIYGGSRSLGGDLDINTLTMVDNLGANQLDELDYVDAAPDVSTGSGEQVTGFSAGGWSAFFSGLSNPSELQVDDFLPTLQASSSRLSVFICGMWNNTFRPALQRFFSSASNGLILWRLATMVAMVVIVGRKFFIFCIRVGPALLNCVVNVLSNGVLKDEVNGNDLLEL